MILRVNGEYVVDQLIADYEYELAEPGCAPGSGRYGVRIILHRDISPVFPYLNAVLQDTVYDRENAVLIGREGRQIFAFRATEIRTGGVEDAAHAPEAVRQTVGLVNRVWRERQDITPNYKERKLPTVIDIYGHLPKTNCRQCGYPTCLAFAAEVRAGNCTAEQCPPLSQPENAPEKEAIRKLFGGG